MNKATPIVLLVLVLVVAGSSFAWFLTSPGGGASFTQGTYNQTKVIVLYANANAWNYKTTDPNPTLNEKLHTQLDFKIIEQDGIPHTFTVNAGKNESSSPSDYIINVQIPTTIGSVVWANWSFSSPGVYTYWCTIHPYAMVGLLYVNSTAISSSNNSTTASPVSASQSHLNPVYQSTLIFTTSDTYEQTW
jgi:hypothetical protein